MIRDNTFNERISTLNLIVFFVGFDFVTSLASLFLTDIAEHSQMITIPFRAFALFISLLVLFFNFRNKIKINIGVFCLFFYLCLLTVRLIYDFGIRIDIDTFRSDRTQVILMFSSMFINTIAVAKSYQKINLTITFKYIFIFYSIILITNFITVQEFTLESVLIQKQVRAGVRNTIATGYIASIFILIALDYYIKRSNSRIYKIILIPILIIAVVILLRAGSRGPLLAVLVGTITYLAFRKKNPIKIFVFFSILLSLVIVFYDEILSLIVKVSPVMVNRVVDTVIEGDKLRMEYFNAGVDGFINNPFTGSYAFVYTPFDWYEYPHQLVIEAFMATGILGGIALVIVLLNIVKNIFFNMRNNMSNLWLELIAITYIVRALTAGSIYFGEYTIVFALILLTRNKKHSINEN